MKGNQHLNGLTFILAVFHFIAMYLYKYLSSDVIFWNVNGKENKIFQFFGGISPIDSSNLVCVILYILPVFFCERIEKKCCISFVTKWKSYKMASKDALSGVFIYIIL